MKIKNILLIGITIFSVFFFSVFFFNKKYENLENEEVIFAYYVDGVKISDAPKINDGKVFDEENSNCTNGAIITWDKKHWGANIKNTNTKTNCTLKFKTKYKESILNESIPVLKDNLIPVTIENNGTVHRADESTEWYSYKSKNWANAVILKDESVSYSINEIIPEDNIESYFVWIPKYRYQLWNLEKYDSLTEVDESKVHTIPVIFGDYDTKDEVSGECTTPMESGSIGNCQKEDYMTHPAFLSIPSTGFWVGKFETGSLLTENYNVINGDAVQIKPNVVSWRSIQVGNAFYTSFNYKRNLDSHMMKNTEWGAVAYLQHSEYGSYQSVKFNNNSNFITGYASVTEPTCGWTDDNRECNQYGTTENITLPYNTGVGYLASTTANISGIYDISGGADEFVMGILTNEKKLPLTGKNDTSHSGFIGDYGAGGSLASGYSWPIDKYYDKYMYGTSEGEYTRGILGDATSEMGPFAHETYGEQTRKISSWYADASWFVYNLGTWFSRGGSHINGSESGMFYFGHPSGTYDEYISFRVVLTPNI